MSAANDDVKADLKTRLATIGVDFKEYHTVYKQAGMTIEYLEYEHQQRITGAVRSIRRDLKAEIVALNISPAQLEEYYAVGMGDEEIIRQHKFLQKTQQERKDKAEAVHKRAVTLNASEDGYSKRETAMKVHNLTIERTQDNLKAMYGAKLADKHNEQRRYDRMMAFVEEYERRNAADYFATHIGMNGANISLEIVASGRYYSRTKEWRERLLLWWEAANDASIKESSVADRQQSFIDALQDCWRGHNLQEGFNRDDGLPPDHSCGIGYSEIFCQHFFGKHPENVFVAEPKYNNIAGDFALNALIKLFFILPHADQIKVVEYSEKNGDVKGSVSKVAHHFYEHVKTTIVRDAERHFGKKIFALEDFQKGLRIAIEGVEYLPLPEPGKEPEFAAKAREAVGELEAITKQSEESIIQAQQKLAVFQEEDLKGKKEASEKLAVAQIQLLNVKHAREMMKEHEGRLEQGLKQGNFESLGLAQIAAYNILSVLPLGQQAFQRMKEMLELVNSHIKQLNLQKKLQDVSMEVQHSIINADKMIRDVEAEIKVAFGPGENPNIASKLQIAGLYVANAAVLMKNVESAKDLLMKSYDIAMKHADKLSTLQNLEVELKNYCSLLPLVRQNVDGIKTTMSNAAKLLNEARQLQASVRVDADRVAQAQQQVAALVNAGQAQGIGLVFGGTGNPASFQLADRGVQAGQIFDVRPQHLR